MASQLRNRLWQAIGTPSFVAALSAAYVATLYCLAWSHFQTPENVKELTSEDSANYWLIAGRFAKGNFSMDYIGFLPHRQPLYPLFLTPVVLLDPQSPYARITVNVVLCTAGLWAVFGAVRLLWGNASVAGLISLGFATNIFLIRNTTQRLMTEPTHVLLVIAMTLLLLLYLRRGQWYHLLGAGIVGGLDYLARPNGLFFMAALLGTAGLADLGKSIKSFLPARLFRLGATYAATVALFALVTAPSWVPRLEKYGDPIYHGYLTNYLWADTYKEAHVREPCFTWRDYVERATFADAAWRMTSGLWRVFIRIPWGVEQIPILWIASAAGIGWALAKGPAEMRFLALFLFLQMLPLAWTNMSNPGGRAPYGSIVGFQFFFAAFLLMQFLKRKRPACPASGPEGEPAPTP